MTSELIMQKPKQSFRLTLCLVRRLEEAESLAQIQWARLKRDVADTASLNRYIKQLRRCERLKAALERRVA